MSTKRRSFPPPLCLLPLFISLEIGRVGSLQLLLNVPPEQATEDRVPDSPTNVRVSQLTPNAATIKWDRPLSADLVLVRGYTLSYGVDSADARRVVLEGQDTLEHTVHGLKPNTSYAFSLTAYNEAEAEDSARVLLLVNTPSLPARDAPEPEESAAGALKPTHLRVERTRQRDEVLLHWNEPVDKLGKRPLYYIVHYSREMFHEVQRLSVERSPALLVGLNSGHKYTARVRAVFDDGTQSAWSDKLTLNGREQSALTWGGLRDAEEEEDFCGFELPSVCDFIREGSWRWERRNSTGDGFNIVLRESASGTAEDQADGLFGRLLSPMYGLSPSDSFCISVQLKLAKGGFGALFRLGVLFEGEQRAMWLFRKSLQRVWPQGEWIRLSFQLHRRPTSRGFQVIFDVSKQRESEAAEFVLSLDNLFVRAADCPAELEPYFGAAPDEETEANLLIPLENLLDSDQRVYRATGLDGLPAVGIKRGVEIVVPYRIYLPRKFYRNFAILASVRPADHLGGFLFAVLNAFDTVVELGLQLQPSGPAQTNISLLYTDSQTERESRVLASFLVPAFTGQWTQFALEVHEQSVGLYFRCMRFAIRQVLRRPAQLQMDDASKLYIANAGPILGGGFEGAIQELKLHDDAAEAANQCNENWWKTRRRNFARQRAYEKDAERDAGSGFGAPDEEKPQGLERMTPPTVSTTFAPPLTMTQTGESQQFGRWTPTAAVGLQGPPGLKGEPGEPGTCIDECRIPPPGPPGLPGPPGTFVGLSDADVLRIAAWPGVKGEKGECAEEAEEGADELVLLNGGAQHRRRLPVYDSRVHAQKGPKGDRGEPGVPGPPGVAAPQQQNHPATGSAVAVYQTALELLAAAPRCPVGRLAFAVSTQQLFLRVHAGWRQILLDSTILAQPQVEAPVAVEQHAQLPASHPVLLDSAPDPELSRLAYWLALDEQPNSGRGEKSAAVIESVLASPLVAPAAPSNSPPTRSVDARPWQSRWPQKEPVAAVDEERDKQRNRVDGAIRHKDKVIHLMALNEPLAGNFGGVRGADMECYRQARQAGFSTTFRAFLSSRVQDLSKIVHVDDRHNTPVVNLRGERLFDSWHSVFDGGAHAHVPLYSFNKKDIFMDRTWSDRWVWHGSSSGGLRSPTYCAEWRSLAAKAFGMASPLHAKHALTDQPREVTCDRKLAVLCVEVMSKYSVDRKLGKRFMADLF